MSMRVEKSTAEQVSGAACGMGWLRPSTPAEEQQLLLFEQATPACPLPCPAAAGIAFAVGLRAVLAPLGIPRPSPDPPWLRCCAPPPCRCGRGLKTPRSASRAARAARQTLRPMVSSAAVARAMHAPETPLTAWWCCLTAAARMLLRVCTALEFCVRDALCGPPALLLAGFEQLAAAQKKKEEEQRSGKRRKADSESEEEEDGLDPEMAAMMGFGGFGTSKK